MRYHYPLKIFLSLAAALVIALYLNEGTAAKQEPENKELKSIETEEMEILKELDSLEQNEEHLETRLIDSQARITRLQESAEEKREQVTALEKIQTRQTESLYRRLKAIYKLREGGIAQVLINSTSVDDLVHKYRYLAAIIDMDISALKAYSERKRQIQIALDGIKAEEEDLRAMYLELEEEKRKLAQTRNSKTALLMKVHERKETYLAMIRTREESREQLIKEVIINPKSDSTTESAPPDAFEKTPPKAVTPPDFAQLKGKLPLPVQGRIKDHFGSNPGLFETYNTRQGVSIIARPGSPVRAVSAGTIIFSDWLQGYGNVIIIDHGHRYYTLTAGMSQIKLTTGQFVNQGDILGNVPNAGKKDERGIYLEIRLRGRALDPGPWFAAK